MSNAIPEEALELLTGGVHVAHLATCYEDRPHVAPVWYRYEDGTVEVVTGGRKLRNIRENSRVALSVQKDVGGDAEWMVALRGTATVIEDDAENREATRRINEKYGADEDAYDQNTLVRIDVASATVRTY